MGNECTFRHHSTRCEVCGPNEIGVDGITCRQCLAGSQPNSAQSSCVPCEPGTRSEIGICQNCEGERLIASDYGQVVCEQCPVSTRADTSHTRCLCDSGTYNGTASIHVCFYRGFDVEHFQSEVDRNQNLPAGFDCDSCPADQLGDPCLTCEDGGSAIAPGYTFPQLEDATPDQTSVFRCHHDMEVAVKRCPGSNPADTRHLLSESGNMCAAGYDEGYICGECVKKTTV